ncbi:MAG: PASTA domain-containing protein, partial [Anaerohalosphaera sp.]|nr:PASTA domain-containing protein [Anaerohalosphaera sp.]
MQEIGANEEDWDKHFVLTNDIDLGVYTGVSFNIIGTWEEPFSGVFNGDSYTISNFGIDTAGKKINSLGLFGVIEGPSAEVKNICMENVNVDGGNDSWGVGSIAARNKGTIYNCSVSGKVRGGYHTGGLVGDNSGKIFCSHSTASLTGRWNTGGLVGYNGYGTISNCFSAGRVYGRDGAGGLAGGNFEGSISNSYTLSTVSGPDSAGGFVGHSRDGTISLCLSLGQVIGEGPVGGFAGDEVGEWPWYTSYTNCFWDIDVNPGLYDTGYLTIQGTIILPGGSNRIEGIDREGVSGLTTEELLQSSTYLDHGWAFAEINSNLIDHWYMPDCGYPVLACQTVGSVPDLNGLSSVEASNELSSTGFTVLINHIESKAVPEGFVMSQEPPAGCEGAVVTITVSSGFPYESGIGTENEPYIISNANQLNAIGERPSDWDKNFVLTSDIDMSGIESTAYNIIGSGFNPFSGSLDGQGHTISNFSYLKKGYYENVGLFGFVDPNSQISNLGLSNVDVVATLCENVGGLVGYLDQGKITNCYVTGRVRGHKSTGGIIGYGDSGSLTNCYAICRVEGHTNVGGLLGKNFGGFPFPGSFVKATVENCYTAGSVYGYKNAGAIGGDWFSQGLIDSVRDIEVKPEVPVFGSTYMPELTPDRTTSEMQIQSTFTDLGWDFVGEEINGTEDIWKMPGCGYPVFTWQSTGTVPELTGLLEGDARQITASAGIAYVTEAVHSKTVPCGHVISQAPAAGCDAAIVTITVSDGFPYESGSGSEDDPYVIRTAEQMNSIGIYEHDLDKHFELMNDIDLSENTGTGYNIIGDITGNFTGVFNGKGRTVSNLSYICKVEDNVGLFGYVGEGGHINNLRLSDIHIDSKYGDYIGGLAGYVYKGQITNCRIDGIVKGINNVGGLAGYNYNSSFTNCGADAVVRGEYYIGGLVGDNRYGNIRNCYAKDRVSGNSHVAGLAGRNYGEIINCYSTSNVSGNSYVGGLTGQNGETIRSCYTSGIISGNHNTGGVAGGDNDGEYKYCFWNEERNPGIVDIGNRIKQPNGVEGKTTAQMQTMSTYSENGFGFIGNGTIRDRTVWRMCVDGVESPRLAWEFAVDGDFACPDGIGMEDLVALSENWLMNVNDWGFSYSCDANLDGVSDLIDFALLIKNWLSEIAPIGHWRLDDNQADNIVTDSSNNGRDGTAQKDTAALTTTGKVDAAFTFDGSGDYVSIPDSADWTF